MSRKLLSILAVVGLLLGMFGATAAAPLGVAAVEPDHITITWGGCRGDVASANYIPNPAFNPNVAGSTPFICSLANYTPGNLGKGWNELDLVPQRMVTQSAGNSNTDYDLRVTADSVNGAAIGYDFITIPTMNPNLSNAACTVTVTDADVLPPPGPDVQGLGSGTIYRNIHIHQPLNSICTMDVDFRLAIGSHLYPGSSLHTHINNENGGTQGVGNKDNSIPVNEILPQSISKDMAATRNADTLWTIQKTATPAVINLGDTCDTSNTRSAGVQIVVTWDKVGTTPSGDAIINIKVYATNPAHRIITVNAIDVTREGATVGAGTIVDTRGTGDVDVPANTANFQIDDDTFTVPSTATSFNDTVTATYKDLLTGIPVPGTTTASDTATVQTGSTSNSTASVVDVEQMQGAGLSFSVPTPPASGSFTNYNGGSTVGPVNWASGVVSADGSITFNKTVSVTAATSTTGTLTDTATLTPTDSQVGQDALASVTISSSRSSTLQINKTIPNVLQGNQTQAFTFNVTLNGNPVATRTIGFGAGQTSGSAAPITGLTFGADYVVSEVTAAGWAAQPNQTVTGIGCSAAVTFNNTFGPASARVQKVTVPAGNEAGWSMTLTGPGTPAGGETVLTTGAGFIPFTTVLQEGTYHITEALKPGWANTGKSAECDFTVDYPADNDRVFECTFTNVQPDAHIVATPFTANNEVGHVHDITATVTVNDQSGGGFVPAPAGTVVSFTLTNTAGATASFVGPSSCATVGTTGQCLVTINSPTAGHVGIHASTAVDVLGVHLIRETNTAGNGTDVEKVFVNGDITVTPFTATNEVRSPHLVTATVRQDNGSGAGFQPIGGVLVTFTLPVNTANATFVNNISTCTTAANGQCSVSINTPTAGSVVIHVVSTWQVNGVTITRSSDSTGNGPDGHKVFVDANIQVSPHAASNPINASHTITVHVNTNDGLDASEGGDGVTGFTNAPAGTVVTVTLSNSGGATARFLPDPPGGLVKNCSTVGATGDCTLDFTSPTAGHVDIHASTVVTVGGLPLTRATGDGLPGDGPDAGKDFVSGTIIIRKVTLPAGGTGFDFVTNGGLVPGGFSLNDGGQRTYNNVQPGPYTVDELDKAGWDLTNLVCDSTGGSTDSEHLAIGIAEITVAGNGSTICTYTNVQRGAIEVVKHTDPAGGTGFTFSGDAAGTIDDGGLIHVGNLVPGTYTSTELAKAGWDLTKVQCNDGASATPSTVSGSTATFKVDPGETVRCRFNNVQRGTIITKKVTVPAGGTGFTFTGTNAGTIDDGGNITTSNLVPGTYTSTESAKTGWDLTNISCDDGGSITPSTKSGSTATFKLDPGETVTCTFTNTQRATVKVTKTFKGGAIPAGQSFTFYLRQGASAGVPGTLLDTQVVTSATAQPFQLNGFLVAGVYQVCELAPGPGWNMTIANDPSVFTLDPLAADVVLCINVTLTPGQNLSLTFDNSPPPGGVALTIGYWKTHSCQAPGKQKDVLSQTLALFPIAAGQTKPGFYVGELYVDTCNEAVSLLSKQYLGSTTKQASDPTINFASQFVAYELNIAAGAGDIPAANAAAAEGQAILVAVHFDGSNLDGDPVHDVLTAAQAATLNKDAGILDKFNNNTL